MSKSAKMRPTQLPYETQTKVSDVDFFSYAENIGKMAVEIQLKADSQVDRFAGHLLVCITLLSSAFLVPFEWAYNLHSSTSSPNMWNRVILLYYLILFLILFTALALTLRSIFLFKVDLLDSPSKQFFVTRAPLRTSIKMVHSNERSAPNTIAKHSMYITRHWKIETRECRVHLSGLVS